MGSQAQRRHRSGKKKSTSGTTVILIQIYRATCIIKEKQQALNECSVNKDLKYKKAKGMCSGNEAEVGKREAEEPKDVHGKKEAGNSKQPNVIYADSHGHCKSQSQGPRKKRNLTTSL